MKQQVKNWMFVPYGGEWWFIHPQTKVRLSARTKDGIMAKAKQHHLDNNLPIGLTFEQHVEEWICEAMPGSCVLCNDGVSMRPRSMTLGDILHGTNVMLRQWFNGKVVVSRDEAERRAAICVKCPMNVEVKMPCTGVCPELRRLVQSVVGAKGTSHDGNLKGCGLCHCWLSASVWVPLEVQCPEVEEEMKPAFAKMAESHGCWKQCL